MMENTCVTYEVERINGWWVVFECHEDYEKEIFSTSTLSEAKEFVRDLQS